MYVLQSVSLCKKYGICVLGDAMNMHLIDLGGILFPNRIIFL